jgi:hypothetical protein
MAIGQMHKLNDTSSIIAALVTATTAQCTVPSAHFSHVCLLLLCKYNYIQKKCLKLPKIYSEAVNRRIGRQYTAKKRKAKWTKNIFKTLQRILMSEQQEPH